MNLNKDEFNNDVPRAFERRVREASSGRYRALAIKTDYLFAWLFLFQWLLGITFALLISPRAWSGEYSQTHIHVYAAIFLGGLTAVVPIFLILKRPGATLNRMVVAVAQILFSVLLIHLTGGRIETHFHIFGSLAFLAFYRDWRTLLIGTIVTAADHLVRGTFWPQSVYGVLTATPWRALEHTAWVLFEDFILLFSIYFALGELHAVSESQIKLEDNTQQLQKAHDAFVELNRSLEEKVTERNKDLVFSNKELEAFSYSVAHDLRTPLRGIDGFGQALLEDYSDKLDSQGRKYITYIRAGTQNMGRIIDDLLSMAKLSRSEMHFQEVDLSQIVQDGAERLQKESPDRKVEFNIASGLKVLGDPSLLAVAMENLIENAWKFTSKQAKAEITFGLKEGGDGPVFFIRDNGVGFNSVYSHKLFQAFQRLHTEAEFKGTGVGLATVQRILQRHRGRIWAESQVNQGSTFYFTIGQFSESIRDTGIL